MGGLLVEALEEFCRTKGLEGEPHLCLPLGQAWLKEPQPGFEPGQVRLYAGRDVFRIAAVLRDRHIFNKATGFNQELWLLGDVFEVFIQISPGCYYEFHVAPQNHQLQMFWTAETYTQCHQGSYRLADAFMREAGLFHSETRVDREAKQWTVYLEFSLDCLDGAAPCRAEREVKIAFTRYDYTGNDTEEVDAVLSATPAFPIPRFHQLDYWHSIPGWPSAQAVAPQA